MPTENSSVKGYIMPILTAIMAPALIAMFTAGWHFAGQVGDNSRDLAEAKRELARVYSEGTAALKSHLQDERYADAKFEGVQEDVSDIKTTQKEIQAKMDISDKANRAQMQELLLILTEIKNNQKSRSPHEGP